jgi:hypothetical protein
MGTPQFIRRKLITILTVESAEELLMQDLLALGANGVSSLRAHGRGAHGVRPSTRYGGNLQVELLVDEALVGKVFALLEERYRPLDPIVAWVQDVDAWPADKFAPR